MSQMEGWHWRDNQRPARFFMFDARSAMILMLVMLYPRQSTLIAFFFVMVFFYILERVGLTFDSALRRMRFWLAGNDRPAVIWTKKRRFIDLGTR